VWRQWRELEATRVHEQPLRTPVLWQHNTSLQQQQLQQAVTRAASDVAA
jgi:hypothetical protein